MRLFAERSCGSRDVRVRACSDDSPARTQIEADRAVVERDEGRDATADVPIHEDAPRRTWLPWWELRNELAGEDILAKYTTRMSCLLTSASSRAQPPRHEEDREDDGYGNGNAGYGQGCVLHNLPRRSASKRDGAA